MHGRAIYIYIYIDVREYASYNIMHVGRFERKSIEKVAASDLTRVQKKYRERKI